VNKSAIDNALALTRATCQQLLSELPRAQGLDAEMLIINSVRRQLIGPGLLTVNLRCSPLPSAEDGDNTLELQRVWTSDPKAYPIAGRKTKKLTPWSRQLLIRGEVFIGEGRTALQAVFDDHALIASLGLQSIVNVPMFDGQGHCFATFNLLGRQPQWMPQDIALAQLLAALTAPAIAREVRRTALSAELPQADQRASNSP